MGGLHVIGTERHEARRIDLQLRGRCGRQGDPGSSRFYLSLEDDLMRIFAGEWVKNILDPARHEGRRGDREPHGHAAHRGRQKKVEERNFEIRKNLLEYDEVMDEQRKRVYGYRQRILDGANCRDLILENRSASRSTTTWTSSWTGTTASRRSPTGRASGWPPTFEPRDFRGMDFAQARTFAQDEAERMAESQVLDAIEENLPDEEETRANGTGRRWRSSPTPAGG